MAKVIYLIGLIFIGNFLFNPPFAIAEKPLSTDEEIFAEELSIEDLNNMVSEEVDQELKKQHFGISGQINTESIFSHYETQEDWLGNSTNDGILNKITTDLFFDFRWKGGVKSFICLGTELYPEGAVINVGSEDKEYHDFSVKECFTDVNWNNQVYFRFGKQLLKWGRSYFWNPTDLVNINKKDFYNMDKNREGATGMKVHIPQGVKRNIYFFTSMEDIECLKDISLAGKYEWLVDGSEMSLSVWYKNGYHPVFGYDISTRIGKVNCYAEVGLFYGPDYKRLKYDDKTEEFQWSSVADWYPQISMGFTYYWDYREIKDRISLIGEFYYNQAGYDKNIYRLINDNAASSQLLTLKQQYFSEEYQAFMNNKYYGAFFCTVNKFIIPELTFKTNVIINLVDYSSALITGVNYKPTLKDFYINFDVYNYFGNSLSEARIMGYGYQLNCGIKFLF